MALLLRKAFALFDYCFYQLPDPRTDDLFAANSVFYPLGIVAVYFYIVLDFGPEFMKNRKPYNIENLLVAYNAFQVVASFCIFLTGVCYALSDQFNVRCTPVNYSQKDIFILRVVWCYYVLKIIDLLDTVFFILRKRPQQVTFLHIYHHFGMVGLSYVGVRYLGGGQSIYVGLVNCFVHTVMYMYYLVSVKNKAIKTQRWKKLITQIQLGQFVGLLIIFLNNLFVKDCTYPKFPVFMFCIQLTIMVVLFLDFYYKCYIKKKPTMSKAKGNGCAVHEKSNGNSCVSNGKLK